ncbi:hypothetical protein E5288_WYG019809 [Bos mutus]|uniref:Uncharacterized protein n=1 Tax=Bos mutus TaxID=72004 RepID=A0A6B0RPF8_9CETA|nr:hypothetical protein [Bos mutus]
MKNFVMESVPNREEVIYISSGQKPSDRHSMSSSVVNNVSLQTANAFRKSDPPPGEYYPRRPVIGTCYQAHLLQSSVACSKKTSQTLRDSRKQPPAVCSVSLLQAWDLEALSRSQRTDLPAAACTRHPEQRLRFVSAPSFSFCFTYFSWEAAAVS